MSKLHQILAVESDLQTRATKVTTEIVGTFNNNENLFKGKVRSLSIFDKTNSVEAEAIENKEKVNISLSTTVPENLNFMGCMIAEYYDAIYQKEATNQQANADLVVEGRVLLPNVPVTFLLSMENRLKELRPVIAAIPTLEPAVNWTLDSSQAKPHVFKSPPTFDLKINKVLGFKVLTEATQYHPAQIEKFETTANIGQYTSTDWSGKISSADKARLLQKLDSLIQGCKKARQLANETTLVDTVVGDTMFGYLFGDWFNRGSMNVDATI